jgi:hypothetical protein
MEKLIHSRIDEESMLFIDLDCGYPPGWWRVPIKGTPTGDVFIDGSDLVIKHQCKIYQIRRNAAVGAWPCARPLWRHYPQ